MSFKKSSRVWFSIIAIGILLIGSLTFWIVLRDPIPRTVAETDPIQEVDAFDTTDNTLFPSLQQRIHSADPGDFPMLMGIILQLENPDEQTKLVSTLLGRWLSEDQSSFSAFLDEAEVDGLDIWDAIAPGMVEALRVMKGTIPETNLLGEVIERVLLKAAESDPEAVLAWARETLWGDHLDAALAGIATELAAQAPESAIELLDEVEIFANQLQAAADVGQVLGKTGYALALEWAESFYYETESAFALSGVLAGMASHDSARAATEYSRIVETMKSRHREQILADREQSGNTVDEEYEGLSPEEIEKAELAKPNPNLAYLENATHAIARELARKDPLTALEWARSMDIYQGRAVAMETAYTEWGAVDPHMAFQSFLKEGDRRPEVATGLFTSWATRDPETASTSALTLKPGFERDSAVEGVALGWVASGGQPRKIATWADQLPTVSEADRVRAVVASEAAFDDPVLAVQQAEQISNPLKRSELFQEVFPNLVEEDPKLARSILSTIRLSPVEIEYFESMLEP